MSVRYLAGILVLVLAGYLLTGVTQVQPGERAVVRRFGRVVDKPGPGLRFGLPYGMERVDRVPVDFLRRVHLGYQPELEAYDPVTPPGQLLTGDHNLVNVNIALDYAVRDEQVEDYVVQAERADALIARAAEAELALWVAGRTVDEVLLRGKIDLPVLLVRRTQERIEPYQLGIILRGASVAYLSPPEEVKSSFDEVTRAQTTVRTREHEARQEAASRLRQAQAEKVRIERQTDAYVQEQLVLARAEATNFIKRLQQYQTFRHTNPHYLAGIWWDEIGKLLATMKKTGRIDLLDNHLGGDGLDITLSPAMPKKKQ
jgi:membrane protease subunit HflK